MARQRRVLSTILGLGLCLAPNQGFASPPAPARQTPTQDAPPARPPPRVFVTRQPDAMQHYRIDAAAARRMVDVLLRALTGKASARDAMASLVQPGDRVGIKISTSAAPYACTHPPVIDAIVQSLRAAGVPPHNIVVWDRDERDLRRGGYLDPPEHPHRLEWVTPPTAYDPNASFLAPVLGRLIWGDLLFKPRAREPEPLSGRSHFPLILTRGLTKVINVPAMLQAPGVGVHGAIANLTVAHVDNWRRFLNQPGASDPALAEALLSPPLRGRVILHIMDGLLAQYAGGPGLDPDHLIPQAELAASLDPVALDEHALSLIDQWRTRERLPPARPHASYLDTAVALGIGTRQGFETIVIR